MSHVRERLPGAWTSASVTRLLEAARAVVDRDAQCPLSGSVATELLTRLRDACGDTAEDVEKRIAADPARRSLIKAPPEPAEPAVQLHEEAEALAAKEGIPFDDAFRRVAKIDAFPQLIPALDGGGTWVRGALDGDAATYTWQGAKPPTTGPDLPGITGRKNHFEADADPAPGIYIGQPLRLVAVTLRRPTPR